MLVLLGEMRSMEVVHGKKRAKEAWGGRLLWSRENELGRTDAPMCPDGSKSH